MGVILVGFLSATSKEANLDNYLNNILILVVFIKLDTFYFLCQYSSIMQAFIPYSLRQKQIFRFAQARKSGLTQYSMAKLVKEGVLEHIGRGLYRLSSDSLTNEDIYRQVTAAVGFPCAISLWSALVFYGFTDEVDIRTWLWVPVTKRVRNKEIRVVRARNPNWRIGIDQHEGYWITSLERTLVEALAYPRYVGAIAAHKAIKRALDEKQTDIGKIIEMANRLNMLKRIQKLLEVHF